MSQHSLEQLHDEHRSWLSELDLFQDEIRYFQNRLAELSAQQKNTTLDEQIEAFRDRFIKMLVKIDIHRYVIHAHDQQIGERMELANRMKKGVEDLSDHHEEMEDLHQFETHYKELKEEFYRFLEEAGKG